MEPSENLERRDSLADRVLPVQKETRDGRALLAQRALEVVTVSSVSRGQLVQRATQVSPARMVSVVHLANRVNPAARARALVCCKADQESAAHQASKAPAVPLVALDLPVTPDLRASEVRLVLLATRVLIVLLDLRAFVDRKATQGLPETMVKKVTLAQQARKVFRVIQVNLEEASEAHPATQVSPVSMDPKVPVVQRVSEVLVVHPATREVADQVLLVTRVKRVSQVSMVNPVNPVRRVNRVHLVSPVMSANLELPEQEVKRASLDIQGHLAPVDVMASLESGVNLVPLATPDLRDLVGLRVTLAIVA